MCVCVCVKNLLLDFTLEKLGNISGSNLCSSDTVHYLVTSFYYRTNFKEVRLLSTFESDTTV